MSEGTTLGKAWVQIVPSAKGISGSISNLLGGEAQSAGISAGTSFGNSMVDAIKGVVAAAGIGTAVKSSIDAGMNFDSEMAHVSAISGVAGEAFDTLRDKALELGSSTKFSASEAAEAFGYMSMAGWNAEQMLNGVDGILSLAAADGLNLGATADIVTDALTAFGLSASDSGHFADVLAVASSSANTNVAMMGETFKYVAPLAGSLKLTAEDVAQAVGLMANAGIKASQAGTALRSGLTRLVSPTSDMIPLMKNLGLAVSELSEEEAKAKIDALEASVTAREKAYEADEEALRESLDKQYDTLKNSLEQQYDAKEKAWDKEISALEAAQEKTLSDTQKAQEAAVKEYEKATEAKLALIDKEYQESLKNTDKAEYDRLKALDEQIAAIEAESEAASKAEEEQERARRRAELQKAIDSAKSAEARMEAERKLTDYNENIRRKDEEADRKARIAGLKAQKDAVKEEAQAERDAAKEKRDADTKAYKEERTEGLETLKAKHKDELAELKRAQKETLEEKKNARKTDLDELKKANNNALAETQKENDRQLKALKTSNKEKLSAYQEYVKEQKKAFESAAKSAQSIVLTDENGNMRTLNETVELLREAFSGLSAAEQAEAASTLFGQEAMSGWLAMLNASGESVNDLAGAIANADGAAERMAAVTQNSLKGAVTSFNSAVEGLQIAAYDKFSDKMTDMVNLARDGVSVITAVFRTGDLTPLKEFGNALLQNALNGITEGLSALAAEAPKMALTLAEGLKTGLPAAASALAEIVNSLAEFIIENGSAILETGSNIALELIKGLLSGLAEAIPILMESAAALASELSRGLAEGIPAAAHWITNAVKFLAEFIIENGSAILETGSNIALELIKGLLSGLAEAIPTLVTAAIDILTAFGGYLWENKEILISKALEIASELVAAVMSALDEIGNRLAEKIPALSLLFENLETVVTTVVVAFGAYKAAMAITGIIDGVSKAITGARGAFELLRATMMANPFVLVATLIAGVVAAVVTLWNTNENFRNAVIKIWDGIKNGVAAAWEGIKTASAAAWEFIKGVFAPVGKFFKTLWGTIVDLLTPVLEAVKAAFSLAWTVVQGVWSVATSFFGAVWEGIQAVFSVVEPVLKAFFSAAWEAVKIVWNVATGFFSAIWESIKAVFSVAQAVLGGFFSTAWSAIVLVWNAATGYFKNIWNTIAGIFSVTESVLKGDFSAAWMAIKDVFRGWGDYFRGLWNDLTNVFSNVSQWFENVGANIVNGIWNGIVSVADGFFSNIGDFVGQIMNMFTGRSGFDEHSPSHWSEGVFRRVLEGGQIGFAKALPDTLSSAEGAARDIRDALSMDSFRVNAGYDYAQDLYRYSAPHLADVAESAASGSASGQTETVTVEQPIQIVMNERVFGEAMLRYIRTRERARGQ